MKRLFVISFILCVTWLGSLGQTIPSILSSGTNVLSSNQRKLKAQKDSVLSAPDRYIHAGKPKPAQKDTARPASKSIPPLASIDTAPSRPHVIYVPSMDRGSCKEVIYVPLLQDSAATPPVKSPPPPQTAPVPVAHTPFLQVHGNVLYNLNYYSHIDTPYNENDIYQHTVQTWLDILVKGQYPFRIFLTNHFSNSPLFHNYSDFNFSYNNSGFNQQIRDELRRLFLQSLPSQKILDSLQGVLNKDLQKMDGLRQWTKNPGLLQKAVEAREAMMRKKPVVVDTSAAAKAIKEDAAILDSIYAKKRRDADSITREVARLQQLLQGLRSRSQAEISQTLQDIQHLDNPSELRKRLPAMGIPDSSLPKGYMTLMAIRSFNLGRSVVNYSELSAKNVSVNGVQVEYNPSLYFAFATGSIDYRFRDLVIQQPDLPRQYLNIFRVGKGLKDGNNLILTWFTGKRQLFNSSTTDSAAAATPSSSLMGFTLEGNYHLTKNIVFTGEVGKSSSPYYANDSTKGNNSHLFHLNDHSNEAWSAKFNAFFPATDTRLKGSYKHLAMNYQSFSIFTDGSEQSAWSLNLDQLFFKKQLDIMLGANTNDFSNPLINEEYRSTTVFKSIQATLRRKNWPIISLGYFPSSQILKTGNGQYTENLFYTLVGNVTQSYTYHHLLMNTSLVYTQFYNKASDSGFTYFNTRNLMLSQSVFLSKFTVQMNASAATNDDYQLYTIEGKVQHTINKWLTLGAGLKYNRQTVYDIDQLGYSGEMTLHLNRLGQIQFSADKGYVPGINKQLVPDNTGRLTYLKTF